MFVFLVLGTVVAGTTIFVTHDQTEAMTLGDRVVVLNKGVVQQVDAPDRLYRRPANTFVTASSAARR
jgi:multiple sugar transport system ATP-binding protein